MQRHFLRLNKYHAMKKEVYGGVEVQLHAVLTSSLDGGEWSRLTKHDDNFNCKVILEYPCSIPSSSEIRYVTTSLCLNKRTSTPMT